MKQEEIIEKTTIDFELKIIVVFSTVDILKKNHKFMKELQCESEQFEKRLIFMWKWILLKFRTILEYFSTNIDYFGTWISEKMILELMLKNQIKNDTKLLNKWWSTLQKQLILYFVSPVLWKEKNSEVKEK